MTTEPTATRARTQGDKGQPFRPRETPDLNARGTCTRAAAGRGRLHARRAFKSGVSLGSKRLPLVPLSACARVCRFHGH